MAPGACACNWDNDNLGGNMTSDFPAGNYRFIPAVFQYSSGAAADSGFEIERVRLSSVAARRAEGTGVGKV